MEDEKLLASALFQILDLLYAPLRRVRVNLNVVSASHVQVAVHDVMVEVQKNQSPTSPLSSVIAPIIEALRTINYSGVLRDASAGLPCTSGDLNLACAAIFEMRQSEVQKCQHVNHPEFRLGLFPVLECLSSTCPHCVKRAGTMTPKLVQVITESGRPDWCALLTTCSAL